jgi:hypothetical protein
MFKNFKSLTDDKFNHYLKSDVRISEKMLGSYFAFEKIGDEIIFYKKHQVQINNIELLLSRFYQIGIDYVFQLNQRNLIQKNVLYCFTYIPSLSILENQYKRLPKNNLILECIYKNINNSYKICKKSKTLKLIANSFDVDVNTPLYNGNLAKDLELDNFLVLKKILLSDNPKISSVLELLKIPKLLLGDSTSNLIFCFKNNTTGDFNTFIKINEDCGIKNDSNRDDILKIINSDIIEFFQVHEEFWNNLKLFQSREDDKYIELMNQLFIIFMKEKINRYRKINIQYPRIFKNNIFLIDIKNIKDRQVLHILNEDDNFSLIYKNFMLMFLKKKKNQLEFLNNDILQKQNSIYIKLQNKIKCSSNQMNNCHLESFPIFEEYINDIFKS